MSDIDGNDVAWVVGMRVWHAARQREFVVLADGENLGQVLCEVDGRPVYLNAHKLQVSAP